MGESRRPLNPTTPTHLAPSAPADRGYGSFRRLPLGATQTRPPARCQACLRPTPESLAARQGAAYDRQRTGGDGLHGNARLAPPVRYRAGLRGHARNAPAGQRRQRFTGQGASVALFRAISTSLIPYRAVVRLSWGLPPPWKTRGKTSPSPSSGASRPRGRSPLWGAGDPMPGGRRPRAGGAGPLPGFLATFCGVSGDKISPADFGAKKQIACFRAPEKSWKTTLRRVRKCRLSGIAAAKSKNVSPQLGLHKYPPPGSFCRVRRALVILAVCLVGGACARLRYEFDLGPQPRALCPPDATSAH